MFDFWALCTAKYTKAAFWICCGRPLHVSNRGVCQILSFRQTAAILISKWRPILLVLSLKYAMGYYNSPKYGKKRYYKDEK